MDFDTAFFCILAAGFITGFSKFSIGGMGLLILPIIAIAYPGPEALGILIPMYIATDILAVKSYGRHASWPIVLRLLPLALIGIGLGIWLLSSINPEQFTLLLGVMIVLILALGLCLDYRPSAVMRHPAATQAMGLLSGFVTMTANAAGPLLSLYLMEQRLSKEAYVGTRAWAFMILNSAKVPLLIAAGFLNEDIALRSLAGLPGLLVGSWVGYWLLRKLNINQFKWLIRGMAAIAAVKMLAFG
ncbi:sulfite exporter TauE/SafE family protein [Hahella sp. HN01]|uniref:sulfite exporter TauE/SafE family protein n=1 Tax=Hahella sp. HN01 TaxID=2847262 RepID=UPI001C1EF786|nr:sulfite exporter TauE/SafE family protein [Hahella sp. HN01]MBU6954893.1 sulfite exporter TauE/SafE family protein [Hahella sp. HN01]